MKASVLKDVLERCIKAVGDCEVCLERPGGGPGSNYPAKEIVSAMHETHVNPEGFSVGESCLLLR